MAANYTIEDHSELSNIGVRTHAEIDSILDSVELSASRKWERMSFSLTLSDLDNEIEPGVVRFPLEGTLRPINSPEVLFGYIDGFAAALGLGWLPSPDGTAIDVYVPTDSELRSRYLADGGVQYEIRWLV